MRLKNFKLYKKGSEANLRIDNNVKLEIATNLPGEFNVYNMTAAAAGAYLLGISLEDIQEGIANLEGVSGRFEYAVSNLPFDVVVDYAHTPDALEKKSLNRARFWFLVLAVTVIVKNAQLWEKSLKI